MEKKICTICQKNKPLSDYGISRGRTTPTGRKAACRKCTNERATELRNARVIIGLCRHCTRPKSKNTILCDTCKTNQKATRTRLKVEVFNAYGGCVCQCCGETTLEFLSIDHINGDGAKHRKSLSKTNNYGQAIYGWLKRNKYPKGFRVLCMNCNFALGKFGYCPHKLKNTEYSRPSLDGGYNPAESVLVTENQGSVFIDGDKVF